MQDMMSLSQFTGGFPNNPFMFGANPAGASFTPPAAAAPLPSTNQKKSQRGAQRASPSPGHAEQRERSVSPASSVASNMSQHQAAGLPANMDFGMFMNSLMMGNSFGSGLPPPPPLGMSSLMPNDLSKLPVDLLAALTSAAAGLGGTATPGLDPNMFSALAQLNSLSNNAMSEEKESSHRQSSNKQSSGKSGHNKPSSPHPSQQQQKNFGNKSNTASSKPAQSSASSSTTSSSSNQMKKSSRGEDVYQGLDLSIKKPNQSTSSSSSSSSSRSKTDNKGESSSSSNRPPKSSSKNH